MYLISALARKLNVSPVIPDGFVHDPNSKDGKERIQFMKTRIGQRAFRDVILSVYQNRCCLTGIDLPGVNRASHIIGWAERSDTRMDPRNGLCLNALHDAAFDRGLITLSDRFVLQVSKRVKAQVPGTIYKEMFESRAGSPITMPERFTPAPEMLEFHRRNVFVA